MAHPPRKLRTFLYTSAQSDWGKVPHGNMIVTWNTWRQEIMHRKSGKNRKYRLCPWLSRVSGFPAFSQLWQLIKH